MTYTLFGGELSLFTRKLEAAMKQAMGSPAIKQRMEAQGFIVPPQGAKGYADFTAAEIANWTKVIKTAGIKAQ